MERLPIVKKLGIDASILASLSEHGRVVVNPDMTQFWVTSGLAVRLTDRYLYLRRTRALVIGDKELWDAYDAVEVLDLPRYIPRTFG